MHWNLPPKRGISLRECCVRKAGWRNVGVIDTHPLPKIHMVTQRVPSRAEPNAHSSNLLMNALLALCCRSSPLFDHSCLGSLAKETTCTQTLSPCQLPGQPKLRYIDLSQQPRETKDHRQNSYTLSFPYNSKAWRVSPRYDYWMNVMTWSKSLWPFSNYYTLLLSQQLLGIRGRRGP